MNSATLFNMALGLEAPWQVEDILFSDSEPEGKELRLRIGFEPGYRFPDESGVLCSVHDTVQREWQHLNFFQHHCFLNCAVPPYHNYSGQSNHCCSTLGKTRKWFYPYV